MAENDNTTSAPNKKGRSRIRSPQITVNVDEARITESVRRSSRHCMIAEAIAAAAPHFTSVIVDLQAIRFSDAARRIRYTYLTPRACQLALIQFDQGVKPQAFSFALKHAAHITRNGNKGRGKPGRTKEEQAQARRASREAQNVIKAPAGSHEPFKPPREYARKIVAALEDPNADLGPAVALQPADGDFRDYIPVVVGGLPPRAPGNIQRKRMFGVRELTP